MSHRNSLGKILYVDDEPDILEIVKLALERIGGFEVEVSANGKEALERISEVSPDLILMDVMMPGMDGPTTLAEMRRNPQCKHIPVIFITAKVQSLEIGQLRQLGALDVIAKPFDPIELSSQIEAIWRKAS
jgi:CheY-like chemotaxis protein